MDILQSIAWIATAVGALIAAFSLRNSAKQARANFLLSLYPLWGELKEARQEMLLLTKNATANLAASPSGLSKDAERLQALREEYKKQIEALEKSDEGDRKLHTFYTYLNFFEIMGLMVRNRYVRLRDIYLLYKGPIIEIDHAFAVVIPQWQKRFDVPEGLYANLLFLITRIRKYERLETWVRSLSFRK